MEETKKILLNSSRLPNNVNVDTQIQLGIENITKPIPLNNVDTTVSQFEQFEKMAKMRKMRGEKMMEARKGMKKRMHENEGKK